MAASNTAEAAELLVTQNSIYDFLHYLQCPWMSLFSSRQTRSDREWSGKRRKSDEKQTKDHDHEVPHS